MTLNARINLFSHIFKSIHEVFWIPQGCKESVTVDGERFTGLNIHGFSIIKVFVEIFSHCLGHKYSLFSINKEMHLYSRKNFHGTLENREKRESLAQRIFPCLRYTLMFH